MKKVSTKIIKNIALIITMMLIAIVLKTNVSEAADWDGSATGGMPKFGSMNPHTGLFPQLITSPGKTIKLDENRLNLNNWKATYSSGIVYCANMGNILRNGEFDDTTYFITGQSTYTSTINTISSNWQTLSLEKAYRSKTDKDGNILEVAGNFKDVEIKIKIDDKRSTTDPFDKDAFVVAATSSKEADIPKDAKTYIITQLSALNNGLEGKKPTPYSQDIDSSTTTYTEYNENNAYFGPKICVMETEEKEGDGYKASGETKTYTNSAEAYALTALEDAYETSKYTEEDIQTAYWMLVDPDFNRDKYNKSGTIEGITDDKLTHKGKELYKKATQYAEFVEKMKEQDGYKASIDSNSAQVIVKRDSKEYIVGPFKLNYPDYTDISYVKSLSITTDTGKTLVIDKNNQDFSLICESRGTPASNGIYTKDNKKMYPKNGEKFFIKFSAEAANFPTKIRLNANFEYINSTKIEYNELRSTANVYQYIGHVDEDQKSEHAMTKIKVSLSATVTYKEYRKVRTETGKNHKATIDHHGVYKPDYSCCGGGEPYSNEIYEWVDDKDENIKYPGNDIVLYQPYVKMGDEPTPDIAQPLIATLDGERTYIVKTASAEVDLTMRLGGKVFLDSTGGKESIANGIYEEEKDEEDKKDKPMYNVVVTLYREDADKTPIGTTKTDKNGNYKFIGLNAMYQYYVKFTYNGQYYEPTTYSGTNTWGKVDYKKDDKENYILDDNGNKIPTINNWETNSNGTDKRQERLDYNARFKVINSSPVNYKTTAKYDKDKTPWLTKGKDENEKEAAYNKTYSKNDLLGLTLNTEGTYKQTNYAVIDEFGNLYSDGKQAKDKDEKFVNIEDIEDKEVKSELKRMVQFVKDCLMNSYTYKPEPKDDKDTQNMAGKMDLYPVYSIFVIDDKPVVNKSLLGWNINVLYNTADHINQGYSERQKADLALKKDIEKVTLEINGQTHTYTYDTLENKDNADGTWDISVRLSDAYYNANYSRELYKSDYIYKASNYGDEATQIKLGKYKSNELEVYVTYKIMIRNQAMSIKAKVDELVDYYDTDYEYINERSYIEINSGENKEIYDTKASEVSRYETISSSTKTTLDGYNNLYIQGLDNKYLDAGQTAYVYLTFKVKKDEDEDKEKWVKLDEYVESGNPLIENKKEVDAGKEDPIYSVGKENIVEINGYSTKYADGTKIPNAGIVGSTGVEEIDIAGLIDIDSNPGNIDPVDVPKDGTIKYENFEDDTDKAPNIRLILNRDDNAVRTISGVVWEDERTETIDVTTTGDGKRTDKETLINGVTVQLVELMENGTEFIWRISSSGKKETSTSPIINKDGLVSDYNFEGKEKGAYAFKSFVPGKYVVRFIYGDTIKTVAPKSLGGLNDKSYNGQDFKSTTYQEGINKSRTYLWNEKSTWVKGQEISGKTLTEVSTFKKDASNNEIVKLPEKNADGTFETINVEDQKGYLYDITESEKYNGSDKDHQLVSDAKDIMKDNREDLNSREDVMGYSNENVTNYIAEVLASHKSDYNPINDRNTLLKDLIQKTQMTAETGLMVIEFEYDQKETDGNKKDNTYKIQNVDLGLEERPKAQLAIDKEVTNVKLTLADGSILFDAKGTASNVLWKNHKPYEVDYVKNMISDIRNNNSSKFGLIQLSMDEELMHGATMEITYKVTVSNVGEVDYKNNIFYYKGNNKDEPIRDSVVTTNANQVIDYVANNLQFNANNNIDWEVISKANILKQKLVNEALDSQLEKYNTIIVTNNLSANLVPSLYKDKVKQNTQDSISVPLVLTQLITSENDTDDLKYRNIVEIVKTSNTVGRRMEYSVVGNQDPTQEPQELDADKAELVKILPPFGNAGLYITIAIVTIIAVGIVIIGVIFIKKKILTK